MPSDPKGGARIAKGRGLAMIGSGGTGGLGWYVGGGGGGEKIRNEFAAWCC